MKQDTKTIEKISQLLNIKENIIDEFDTNKLIIKIKEFILNQINSEEKFKELFTRESIEIQNNPKKINLIFIFILNY